LRTHSIGLPSVVGCLSSLIPDDSFRQRRDAAGKRFLVGYTGYARTFTPPEQVLAAPTNLALVQGTTQQPSVPFGDPVRAERADIYDVGVVQQVLPGLEVGVDAYYKKATNLIDDGQFGAAYVLTAFNYAQGENVGVELSAKYKQGPWQKRVVGGGKQESDYSAAATFAASCSRTSFCSVCRSGLPEPRSGSLSSTRTSEGNISSEACLLRA
jgi:TonB dependent receptor